MGAAAKAKQVLHHPATAACSAGVPQAWHDWQLQASQQHRMHAEVPQARQTWYVQACQRHMSL